jgi:hypothetical protein
MRPQISKTDLDEDVLCYGSSDFVEAVRSSHPDFDGLAGLPLLRMTEYGGDSDAVWIRRLR